MAQSILCQHKKGSLPKPYPWANPPPPSHGATDPTLANYCIFSKINSIDTPIF